MSQIESDFVHQKISEFFLICRGEVTISDAVRILQYLSNSDKYGLSEQAAENADVSGNSDGITANDAAAIQRYDAGLVQSLPEK